MKTTHASSSKPVRAATLADVGRAAGVSAMAASTVLNGARTSSRIAPETRERIEEAAARLRYRPNAAARALVNRRMNTIGVAAVVSDGELDSYTMEVFNGILAAASVAEQTTTMFTLHDWGKDIGRLSGWCDGRIDGIILLAPTFGREAAKLLPTHTPFASLHGNTSLPDVINIESDEEHGAYELVRYLIAQGHRRIMHVAGERGMVGAERRIAGYKRALASAGLRFSESLFVSCAFTIAGGREAMRGWLRHYAGKPLPDAVFCANDGIAIGCLEALAEAGLRVPEDISIAGFDDTQAARTTVPQLATVRQPLRAMGMRAVQVLLDSIARQNGLDVPAAPNPIVFPVEIVPRASVAVRPVNDRATRLVPA